MLDLHLQRNATDGTGHYRRLRRSRYLNFTAIVLAAGLLLLIASTALLTKEVVEIRDSMASRQGLRARSQQIQRSLFLLQQVESGQRGYLLTHAPEYLPVYEAAKSELDALLPQIVDRATADDPAEGNTGRLRQLISGRMAEIEQGMRLENAGESDAARELVRVEAGPRTMSATLVETQRAIRWLTTRVVDIDTKILGEMRKIQQLALWTAALLTLTICIAAYQLRSLTRLRSAYEKQVAAQASLLDSIVDEIPQSVAVWDETFKYRLVNKAFERWSGKSRDLVINRSIAEVSGAEEFETLRPLLGRALNGEHVTVEREYPVGSEQYVEADFSPFVLRDGAVIGVVGLALDITSHRRERERLKKLNERDSLTDLLNRTAFEAWLTKCCEQGEGQDLAVLYIDLDHFKSVNDSYGHAAGDAVLKQFAARATTVVRPMDVVARLGGDEFAVGLKNVRSALDAQAIAQKIVAEALRPMLLGRTEVRIGASVGVAVDARGAPGGWRELLERADAMLYESKREGRGRATIHGRIAAKWGRES